MLSYLKKLFTAESKKQKPSGGIDISTVIEEVKKNEQKGVPLGKRIHTFEYQLMEIRLDCDIASNYRVTVYEGEERRYSFTVFAKQGDYDTLEQVYGRIIGFLDGDRQITGLPDNDTLKGFYYGH